MYKIKTMWDGISMINVHLLMVRLHQAGDLNRPWGLPMGGPSHALELEREVNVLLLRVHTERSMTYTTLQYCSVLLLHHCAFVISQY